MTVTPRRVLALTAVTVGLAAAVGITGDRTALPARPLLAPGLTYDGVDGLELDVTDQRPVYMSLREPPPPPGAHRIPPIPDEAAVRDLISVIAAARFDRVLGESAWQRAGLEQPVATLRLDRSSGGALTVRVGHTIPASGQTWIAVDRTVGLAPGWVADAIVRAPGRLWQRRPFAAASALTDVAVQEPGSELRVVGDPPRRLEGDLRIAVDPRLRDRLRERLAALTIEPEGDPFDVVSGGASAIHAGDGWLREAGVCPGQPGAKAVQSSVGDGCVDGRALDQVFELARALATADAIATAPAEAFDARSIDRLEQAGAETVSLVPEGAGWTIVTRGGRFPADAARVRDVVVALTSPATRIPLADVRPAPRSLERWVLHHRSGDTETWEVERTPARVSIRRDGEPVRLVLDEQAAAAVRLVGPALRDRTLLTLEPTSITAIAITGAAPASLARGALIDEWLVREPAGATASTAAIAALRERLASLRAVAWLDDGALGPARRTLRVTTETFPGQPAIIHTIAVGRARPGGGCAARVDDLDVAALDRADCAALLAPLTVR